MVRTAAEWRELQDAPRDFDPEDIWEVCEKLPPDSRGHVRWMCPFCQSMFKSYNATKARAHVAKLQGADIAPCKCRIPEWMVLAMRQHVRLKKDRKDKRKRKADLLAAKSEDMTELLALRRKRQAKACGGRHLTIHSSITVAPSAALSSAIAEMIVSEGLPHSLVESQCLKRVIHLARQVPADYMLPPREAISGELLDAISSKYKARIMALVQRCGSEYGWSLLSDSGGVSHQLPLISTFAGIPDDAFLVEALDCTNRMSDDGEEDDDFLIENSIKCIQALSPKSCFLAIFDGAGNEASAGALLEVKFPWLTLIPGSEYVVHMFLKAVCEIREVKQLLDEHAIIYNEFTQLAPHQTVLETNSEALSKSVELLVPARVTATHASIHFIVMHKILRLKAAYQANLISDMDMTDEHVVSDQAKALIMDESKWRKRYVLCRAVWPWLRLLRTVDSTTASMGILLQACCRAEDSLARSRRDIDAAFNGADEGEYTVYEQIVCAYKEYAPKLKHDWAKIGFLTNPMLWNEVSAYRNHSDLDTAAENVVRKIFHGTHDLESKLTDFFSGLREFLGKSGPFSRPFIWNDTKLLKVGETHKWHKQYSTPHKPVFGKVAQIVQAQLTGIGARERNWDHVKQVWDCKLATSKNPAKVEKEMVIYEEARRRDSILAVSNDVSKSPIFKSWTEDEMSFDLGLENFDMSAKSNAIDEARAASTFTRKTDGVIRERRKRSGLNLYHKIENPVCHDEDDTQLFAALRYLAALSRDERERQEA